MATTTFELNFALAERFRHWRRQVTARGLWLGLILLAALIAFEVFNFATTEYALASLLGEHDALGIATWARILAVAFCAIDFAGLARLFTPETGRKEPKEVWLLTGAWLLGAGMNAVMTWWAVVTAFSANPRLGNELFSRADMLAYGPPFIAGLTWLTRVLIIGTFAFAGDHLFSTSHLAGRMVDSPARPLGGGSRTSFSPAEPRAMPGGTARSLPERSTALGASAYNDSGPRRHYEAQRSFFGSGVGGSAYGGNHATASVGGTINRPIASGSPVDQAAEPVARSSEPLSMPSASPAAPRMEAAQPAPADLPASGGSLASSGSLTGSGSLTSSGSAAGDRPRWTANRSENAASPRTARPDAFNGPSSRASTTRTIGPASGAPARPIESRPEPTPTEPVSMELEYVDLD